MGLARLLKGGAGSGNFSHSGRPGEKGGSAPSSGSGSKPKGKDKRVFGNEINEEKLAQHLGVPKEIARYMLAKGLVGVSFKNPPTAIPFSLVPKAEADHAAEGKKYPGKCYDMAARYVMDSEFEAPLKDAKLIHGTLTDGVMTIGHAWVETPSGLVFDASHQTFYAKSDYYKKMGAVAERTYPRKEANKNLYKYKHYGPWHDGAGYVAGAKGKKNE